MVSKEKTYKLDLFGKLIPAIDKRDFNFYSNLSDEEKKGFSGIVALRTMSAVSDSNIEACKYFIQAINDVANKYFWNPEISKNPEMQYLILAVCGAGKFRHEWIKGPSRISTSKIVQLIKEYYPLMNNDEVDLFLKMNDIDSFVEMAKILGYQDNKIVEIKKEAKKLKNDKR